MTRPTLLPSNCTQAVRLPENAASPDDVREVRIPRDGIRRVIVPVASVWDDFFDSPGVGMPDREDFGWPVRDPF